MQKHTDTEPTWENRGKTIKELIRDLLTFENQNQEVRISADGGDTIVPISAAVRRNGMCILLFDSPQ